jgi:hypothetical protein
MSKTWNFFTGSNKALTLMIQTVHLEILRMQIGGAKT